MVNCKLGDLTMEHGDRGQYVVHRTTTTTTTTTTITTLSLVVGERKSRGREQEFIRGLIGSASRDFAR